MDMTEAEYKNKVKDLENRVSLLEHWLDRVSGTASGLAGWGRCYCDKEDHTQCIWQSHVRAVEGSRKVIDDILGRSKSLSDLVYPKGHYHGD